MVDNDLNIIKKSSVHTGSEGFNITTAVLTNNNLECLVLNAGEETRIMCIKADGKNSEIKLNASGNLIPYNTGAGIAGDGKSIYIYSTSVMAADNKHCNGLILSQLDCNTQKTVKTVNV